MVQHLMVQLPICGMAHSWHTHGTVTQSWCGNLCCGTLSHGAALHGMTPSVTVTVTLLIKPRRFIPMKIITWVAAECDLEHSSLPIPSGGKTVHHVRELRAGTWQQCLHSVILTPEHHKTDQSL